MSDVNINTSWSSLPSSDTEYNTVLGVAGYDPDDNRLFLSAQQTPNIARNVTTEYARGFSLKSGYDGIVTHDAMTESSADLRTVKFTMSAAGSAYDLADARCYVQFKNRYSVEISSWALQAQAEDETLTTVASGSTIAAGGEVQIDFKNDYNAARFIMTITYPEGSPGEYVPSSGYWVHLPPHTSHTVVGSSTYTLENISDADMWACHASAMSSSLAVCSFAEVNNKSFKYRGNILNLVYGYNLNGHTYYHSYTSWANSNAVTFDGVAWPNSSFSTNSQATAAFYAGSWTPGAPGLKTNDFNEYTGNVWQCRMIANVAAISPGPMATESEGGTEGDFDITSDQITAPALPSEGYAGTASMYLVDKLNLNHLKLSIFSANFWQQWITNFNDAVNSIVGILQIPVDASVIPTGALEHVRAANKELEWTLATYSGYVEGKKIQSRYISVDCGTVDLHLFWDSALDLNPYTKLNIYIPCVGIRTLDPDVVMGHTLGLYYNIDLMQGCALAVLTIDGDYLEQYPCSISTMFAIYGEQFTGLYQSVASTLATAAIGVTTAGSGGAMAGAIAGAATSAMAQKIHKGSAGTSASSMALLYQKQPYVEILRPIQQLPRDYTKFSAYPSYMTSQLINLSGYVEVQDIRLDDIDCTDAERTELMNMLQSGVIL